MAKVGPPTHFCGPWTFFYCEKKQHVDLLLPEIWSKAVNKSMKRTKKISAALILNCAARDEKIVYKFGPRSKTSAHPCNRALRNEMQLWLFYWLLELDEIESKVEHVSVLWFVFFPFKLWRWIQYAFYRSWPVFSPFWQLNLLSNICS